MPKMPDYPDTEDLEEIKYLMTWHPDRYWDERDEYEAMNPLVLDCGNPDCIMSGYHRLSECVTAEDLIAQEEEALIERGYPPEVGGAAGRWTRLLPVVVGKPQWRNGVTWWPCLMVRMEEG